MGDRILRLFGSALLVIGLIFTIIKAIMKGFVTIEIGVFILLLSIFLISISAKWVSILLRLIVFSIPIWLFMKEFGFGFNSLLEIIWHLLPLLIMLYGLYIMLHHGLFGGKK